MSASGNGAAALKEEQGGRERLLAAALAEFSARGFSGASIARIAAEAGVGKSTVFHHFDSKQTLYLAVIRSAAMEFSQTLSSVLADARDPQAGLAAFQRAHLAHVQRNRQVASLVLRELQEDQSERAATLVREVLAPNFSRVVTYLRDAAAAGQVRSDVPPQIVALTLMAANILFFQHRAALNHLPGFELGDDPAGFATEVADLVVRGLAGASS